MRKQRKLAEVIRHPRAYSTPKILLEILRSRQSEIHSIAGVIEWKDGAIITTWTRQTVGGLIHKARALQRHADDVLFGKEDP